jgi:hypothetical protein
VAVTYDHAVKAAVVWAVNGVVMGVVAVMMASVSGVDTGAICTGVWAIGSFWLISAFNLVDHRLKLQVAVGVDLARGDRCHRGVHRLGVELCSGKARFE